MKPYLLLPLLLLATIAAAEPIQPSAIEIVDGDTIIVRGDSRHVRLLGFDTPEMGFEARCERERTLAAKATQRLHQLVAGGDLDLAIVPCPCWRRHGMFGCNLGRYCGVLKAKNRDVSALMISEGLARPGSRKDWLPHHYSWC